MASFRAKTYTNAAGKEAGKGPNKAQVSGDIGDFAKIAKGDRATIDELIAAVSEMLKK